MIPIQEYQTGLLLFMTDRTRDHDKRDAPGKTCNPRQYCPKKLQALLASEVTGLRTDRRHLRCALACAGLALLAVRCLIAYFHGSVELFWGLLAISTWLALLSWVAYYTEKRITRKHMVKLARQLQRHESPQSVGPLIDAIEIEDCTSTATALVTQLARLRCQDATLLNSRRRTILYRVLHSYNSELIIAILKAFEQVGDDEAIPHVKRLTPCPVWLADRDRIEAAAGQCLRVLYATADERKARRLLLRTARAPTATAIDLLRPMRDPADIPANQLLRAVDDPNSKARVGFTTRERKVAP